MTIAVVAAAGALLIGACAWHLTRRFGKRG